jgi:hypothetical protein
VKKPDVYLKEYCQRLSDENVKFLVGSLTQRLSGDVAEVLNFLGNVRELDRWLASAQTSDDLFDMIDLVQVSAEKEYEKRCSTSTAA